jgi:hypothetical protein
MKFAEMTTTKKGAVGEDIVRRILEDRGLIIYECNQNRGHIVDFFAARPGRYCLFGVEVKTKPRKAFTPTTGIDTADYRTYIKLLSQGIDTVLFFVDVFEEAVYYSRISDLTQLQKPEGLITYFPLSYFTIERKLSRNELNALERYGYNEPMYTDTERFFVF